MKRKFKAAVIDDNEDVRRVLVDVLRFSDFQADGYSGAEEFLGTIIDLHQDAGQHLPDLVIIDLELSEGKIQGLDLVCRLVDKDVPSEILAVTGHHSSSDLIENAVCFGAATIFTKPFDIYELSKRAEQLARIGRNRRLSRQKAHSNDLDFDPSRRHRPVFLSYSTPDCRLANGIRRGIEARGIGVWYAPATIDIGDEWRERIESGIDEASIFLPLVSDSYMTSSICIAELTRFRRRVERDRESRLVILPALGHLSAEGRRDPTISWLIQTLHGIPLAPRITDGLTALLARVQQRIHQEKK
jgi:FixJ family two-component response regulator